MANIPVQKKSSSNWIWILLALVLVALLIWWLLSEMGDDDPDMAVTNDVESVEVVETGTITTLVGLDNLEEAIGREVNLQNVAVNEVIGDMHFTIAEGDREAMVMFDEVPTPGTEKEGLVDVNPGSRVSLEGEVRAMEGPMPPTVTKEIADDTMAFIYAERVSVIDGGETP
ncbi:MAG: hypothetical protein WA918_04345 [Erythrobacter sp.]